MERQTIIISLYKVSVLRTIMYWKVRKKEMCLFEKNFFYFVL